VTPEVKEINEEFNINTVTVVEFQKCIRLKSLFDWDMSQIIIKTAAETSRCKIPKFSKICSGWLPVFFMLVPCTKFCKNISLDQW
jgi:hypothetical protein